MTSKADGNLWRASSAVHVEAPPLTADADADLVIIGGGFTGNTAALEAARRGASVIVLEGKSVGHGGSGRNVGLVNAGLWLPPRDVVAQMGQEAGLKLVGLLADAPKLVWSLIERENIDCDATPNGTLHLAHSAAGLRNLEERHRQGVELGASVQLFDARETARRTGSRAFYGSLFDPRAGTIQPLSYARGLASAALRAGACLHEQTAVSRVERIGDRWQVTANGHTVRAGSLLLATNAYFKGINIAVRPQFVAVNYCQFATAPMSEPLRAEILSGGEGCWDTALVMSSFRTDRAGRMIVGGIGDAGGPGAAIHAGWARRKLRQVYPQLADLAFEHAWHGRIAMTGDHIPKILKLGPSAYACFGYSGRGIGPGTVFGTRAAAALLDGREDDLPVAPVAAHTERFVGAWAAYYEAGAVLTHAL
ncbi:NAD(P)/FAD-dependent oxidoreductase [Neoaquamicrobium sediminum]|uniref:NAD(P)/FAD-dependent oxidoreductase n=1 Tax=Neoaquamicrobium sediminum TaxID=1849104 RepID=UPI003BAD2DAA